MKTSLYLIILITLTTNSLAQDLVRLTKDTPAPYTGVLVPDQRLNEFRVTDEKYKVLQKENIVLKDLRMTDKEIIDFHKEQAKEYRKKLTEAKFDSNLSNMGYFLAGALVTAIAVKLTTKIGDI